MTIGDETVKVYLFVATLGYSRRLYVRAFRNERQESWFAGVEGAFEHFGGITEQVLLDNDRRSPGPEQAFIIVTVAAVNRAFKGPSSLRPRSEAKRKGWECSGQLLALKRPAVAPAEGLLTEALLKHARYALERHP